MSMRNLIDITEGFAQPKKYIAQGIAEVGNDSLWLEKGVGKPPKLKVHILPTSEFWYHEEDKVPIGNLNVYFNPRIWDIDRYGLIYTDTIFEKHIKRILKEAGFKYFRDIDYSEQGMQGDDFVNFDVDDSLAKELNKKGFIIVVPYNECKC